MGEQRPEPTKTQRTCLGLPVNWDTANWNKGMWNAEDHRLFPPKRIGIGWTINVHELLRRLNVLR
jgi:uncharacterized membrane protein